MQIWTNKSKAAGTNDYVDYGIRMAHAFSPKLAANFTYLRGTDWYATNYDDKTNVGRDRSHVNYDGINVYGDEVTNIKGVAAGLLSAGAISQSQFAAFNSMPL
jgi:hypothetical protein